ncbi:UNVERIFIED_CONTAM: hypothetical protein NCL1_55078 [Trichonephila clavipes]
MEWYLVKLVNLPSFDLIFHWLAKYSLKKKESFIRGFPPDLCTSRTTILLVRKYMNFNSYGAIVMYSVNVRTYTSGRSSRALDQGFPSKHQQQAIEDKTFNDSDIINRRKILELKIFLPHCPFLLLEIRNCGTNMAKTWKTVKYI